MRVAQGISRDVAECAKMHVPLIICASLALQLTTVSLQSRRATAEELTEFPARVSLTDAIKHISWVAENYDALEQEFPNHPWNAVMTGGCVGN